MDFSEPYIPLVQRTVELYEAHPENDEQAIAKLLVNEGAPESDALFAACIVPSAFGRVLAHHLGVEVSDEFLVRTRNGQNIAYIYSEHPISRAALRVAVATYVHGPRNQFEVCATRSAEFRVVNKALSSGAKVKGASLASVVFGIFAEQVGDIGRKK